MNLKGAVKGIKTTGFVATRVVAIAAAGLIAVAIATSIKDRFTKDGDELEIEITEDEV